MSTAPAAASLPVLAAHGVSPAAVLRLLDDLDGLDPHALVLTRHGTELLRASWAPYRADRPALVYSASKTVTALAIGLLEAEGRIDPAAPVDRYLDLPNPAGLTVHHLLTMTTGHSREQTLAMPVDHRALLATPPAFPVGSRFAYNSPASALLARLVHRITGEQPTDYLRPRLFTPLGIGDRWWRRTDGVDQGFSGLHLTAVDLARIGGLLADRGRAGGVQLVPEGFVDRMTRAWTGTHDTGGDDGGEPDTAAPDWARGYGYQVWRSRHGFRLDGAFGQLAVVVPGRGLVIGYQGATGEVQRVLDAFWRLVEGVVDHEVPAGVAEESARLAARLSALDSWDARHRLAAQPVPGPDSTGWALTDRPGGWWLDLPRTRDAPGGRVEVRSDGWSSGALHPTTAQAHPAPGPVLPVAARGERRPDGSVRVHLVVTTAPHRVLLTRSPAGAVEARWHLAPLWRPALATLLVPPEVAHAAAVPSRPSDPIRSHDH